MEDSERGWSSEGGLRVIDLRGVDVLIGINNDDGGCICYV